jgi:hypothetical protein
MPRALRVLIEGGLYHVYNRFARGEEVFAGRGLARKEGHRMPSSPRRSMPWTRFSLDRPTHDDVLSQKTSAPSDLARV